MKITKNKLFYQGIKIKELCNIKIPDKLDCTELSKVHTTLSLLNTNWYLVFSTILLKNKGKIIADYKLNIDNISSDERRYSLEKSHYNIIVIANFSKSAISLYAKDIDAIPIDIINVASWVAIADHMKAFNDNLLYDSSTDYENNTELKKYIINSNECMTKTAMQCYDGVYVSLEDKNIKENEELNKLRLNLDISKEDRYLVKSLKKGHVPSEKEIFLIKEIFNRWNETEGKLDVILLEGPAGSGKTQIAESISYHLGLPYRKITCSSGTDEMTLTGAILPSVDDNNLIAEKYYKTLGENAEITFANISKVFLVPELIETEMFPEKVNEYLDKFFAIQKSRDSEERVIALSNVYSYYVQNLSNVSRGLRYSYKESELVKALKGPCIIEIQEPASIKDEGVLQILNSILEFDGSLELPDFRQVKRHKDCIVVFTTNRGYVGNKSLNQALRDRAKIALKIDLPSCEEMGKRVISKLDISDKTLMNDINSMAELTHILNSELKEEGITSGEIGMRSFIEWVRLYSKGETMKTSFEYSCAYKVTTDKEELETLWGICRANSNLFSN